MSDAENARRQTPADGEIFLDHVGWYVADMDACTAAFERLGFRLTPYTEHSHADAEGNRTLSGTANRCAMLELGYLEFLTAVPSLDTPLTKELKDGLARYPGLHLIAFTCADAAAEHARLEQAGFALRPLVRLRRPSKTDDGAEAMCAFSVIRPQPGEMAEGRIQTITQETPDVVWQPSMIARDNAIDMLSGVVVCADDPEEAVGRFERFTQKAPRALDGRIDMPLERGCLSFVTPAALGDMVPGTAAPTTPYIAAVAMRSRDLDETRAFLQERGVRHAAHGSDKIIVPGAEALGATLIFHAAGAWPA